MAAPCCANRRKARRSERRCSASAWPRHCWRVEPPPWWRCGPRESAMGGSRGTSPRTSPRATAAPRPLAGRTVVVTRAAAQAQRFTELLEASGARVIEAPAIAIGPPVSWEPLDAALTALETFTWVVFTSTNGVLMVDRRLAALGLG